MSERNTAENFTFCSRAIIFTTCADYGDDEEEDECETITAVATGQSVSQSVSQSSAVAAAAAAPPSPFHSIAKPRGIRSDRMKKCVLRSMLDRVKD